MIFLAIIYRKIIVNDWHIFEDERYVLVLFLFVDCDIKDKYLPRYADDARTPFASDSEAIHHCNRGNHLYADIFNIQ